ncbi:TonB-dependent siderophore receptor [Sphingomonas silueang]|uniref:TonB-dependent siderophore receptor n=1 Tax=Sphingomonas silueang TaxID=3156617 RepID=UPI0032B36A74
MTTRTRLLLSAVALSALTIASSATAQTADADAARPKTFHIPAGRLAQSVLSLSEQAGVQVVFDSDTTGGVQANAVDGALPPAQALDRLLAGTGLRWRWLRTGVVTIEAAATTTADGERVTGAVRVEGAQGSPHYGGAGVAAEVNGVNGSRDVTATEGTKSFTSGALTIGSKVPQSIKDVPQSVSVLTSERMQQQVVQDYTQAMRQLPGVSLVQGLSSLETIFYSRGFEVGSIQIDGGAPLSTNISFVPQIDMSVYDHVELLRGAAGRFNGYGTPGGTVNLVRKKPLDHAQFTVDAQAGSWSDYRVVTDVTSPLAWDGKLRGRLVMTYQDRHYFYDRARDDKTLVYGIAKLDATPTTLLTAGVNYTRQNSLPWQSGLPRYLNGGELRLPRSTCLCFSWNRWDFRTTEIFGGVEQKLGGDWTAKLNLTWNRQDSTQKVGLSNGAVNPTNQRGPMMDSLFVDHFSDQLSLEAMVSGSFYLFGQRQEITIGANKAVNDASGQRSYNSLMLGTAAAPYQPYAGGPNFYPGSPNGTRPAIAVFAFNAADPLYSEPRNSLPASVYPVNKIIQSVGYATVSLTPIDRIHVDAGIRWNRSDTRATNNRLCVNTSTTACATLGIGAVHSQTSQAYATSHVSWPPSGSLSADVTATLRAYIGYADIYQDQSSLVTADGAALAPVTGSNVESGFKWAPNDGRLNVTLAAYLIRQKGFGVLDGARQDLGGGRYCCYVANPDRTNVSRGVDAEITGAIGGGWQVSASYTYNRNRYEGSGTGTNQGLPLLTIAPRHLYKLWASHDFGAAGHAGALSRLSVSGGANGQSSAYRSGTVCVNLVGTPNPVTGAQSCASSAPPNRVPFSFMLPAYVLVSGRIDYRLSDRWSAAVNFDNILDKTYYATVGSVNNGNWYGAPRSAMFSVRGKW